MDQIECVVIGAGVIGLAVARALAARGREVIVLEAAEAIGVGTSSRNSEVIHAGIYYPRGSQKAALCVRGRELLYEYCAARNVPHQRCGNGEKLRTAFPGDVSLLDKFEISLINQSGSLESVSAPLFPQITMRLPVQLIIHDFEQDICRIVPWILVPIA